MPNYKAQTSRGTKRKRDEEQIRPSQTPHLKLQNHIERKKQQRRNRLGTVSSKTIERLNPVLLVRKFYWCKFYWCESIGGAKPHSYLLMQLQTIHPYKPKENEKYHENMPISFDLLNPLVYSKTGVYMGIHCFSFFLHKT